MSTKAQAILEQFETLPPEEQRELWRELARRIAEKESAVELYGEPLTDDDIAESAPVTFQMLAETETLASSPASVSEAEFEAALDEVTGCTVGSSALQRLLEDRRRDREHDEACLEARKRNRARA